MPAKTRSATHAKGALRVEQPSKGNMPMINPPPNVFVDEEVVVVENVKEVLINQVFGKMMEILQNMTKKKGPRANMKLWSVS
jgi:hypothetical protein